jgi:hypothetical protein
VEALEHRHLLSGGPGALQIAGARYLVDETGGGLDVAVLRSDGDDGTVTVHYQTADGTATGGQDYTATTGTLTFGPGETAKPLRVGVLNNTAGAGTRSFQVTLSNPGGGATLGAQAATEVRVLDVHMSDSTQFLTAVYRDLLGREPDAAALAEWGRGLEFERSYKLEPVTFDFVNSVESRVRWISGYYQELLGRSGAPDEVGTWVWATEHGLDPIEVRFGIVESPEYFAHQGGTHAAWMDGVYEHLLGLPRDDAWQQAVDRLDQGTTTRSEVVSGLVATTTADTDHFIQTVYAARLGRQASASELTVWHNKSWRIGRAGTPAIVGEVLASDEYMHHVGDSRAAWVTRLYTDVLGRAPETAGFNYWLYRALDAHRVYRNGTASVIQGAGIPGEYLTRLMDGWFQAYVGRSVTPDEAYYLRLQVVNQWGGDEIAQAIILGTDEYFQRAGGTDAAFEAGVFRAALGRDPGPDDTLRWSGDSRPGGGSLPPGMPFHIVSHDGRRAFAYHVLTSAEAQARLAARYFSDYLHRPATPEDIAWAFDNYLSYGHDQPGDLRSALLGSTEYFLLPRSP